MESQDNKNNLQSPILNYLHENNHNLWALQYCTNYLKNNTIFYFYSKQNRQGESVFYDSIFWFPIEMEEYAFCSMMKQIYTEPAGCDARITVSPTSVGLVRRVVAP
jgi:hypothetical protein